ncbi:MAG: enoyl-CoA hydratase/isomerase family protein, partial [Rhodospirillales bacterium]
MTADAILISHDAAVATVTLNRPEKRNALNRPMWLGLTARFAEIAADDSIRAVVLTGAGDH